MTGRGVREVGVFVDESGSFDPNVKSSRYYLICMVFHDQINSIDDDVVVLDEELRQLGIPVDQAVHAGPLIRWESPYRSLRRQDRRVVFARMMAFLRHIDVRYRCFQVDKRFIDSTDMLHDNLLQQIVDFLLEHSDEFNSYDALRVYYDNGQAEVGKILRDAFPLFSSKLQFVSDVLPERYRLFQVADMIATLELVRIKLETEGRISEAEKDFFLSVQNLRRNYLKPLLRKIYK